MATLPLEEIRILDLSQVFAGPVASRILADTGAEVIRIESSVRSGRGGLNPQQGAVYPDGNPGERPYNRSAYYNELHRNKYATSLDLSEEQGREVFLKLVQISDVVLENFTPRVMANFRLDYPVLKQIKSDIIMVSISAYGQTGPYRNCVSFGRGIEAMSGLSQITGYPDSQPLGPGTAYADATAGLHAAFATLVALRHRRRTGRGQHIDLSLRESLMAFLGKPVLDHSINRRSPERMGNQDASEIFQGCYRCHGSDEWVAISIHSEEELVALCRVISTGKEMSNDLMAQQQNRQELDNAIERWTVEHDPQEAMTLLQQAGVPAGAVFAASEISSNIHLKNRGFFETVTHPEAGTHDYAGMPWKLSRTPGRIRMPAPCFAQHNDYVFGELLGMANEEIAKMEEDGITSKTPLR